MKSDDPRGQEPTRKERFIDERALSERWDISMRSLQRWRAAGLGPAWIRIGGRIRYAFSDVLDYEARGRRGD